MTERGHPVVTLSETTFLECCFSNENGTLAWSPPWSQFVKPTKTSFTAPRTHMPYSGQRSLYKNAFFAARATQAAQEFVHVAGRLWEVTNTTNTNRPGMLRLRSEIQSRSSPQAAAILHTCRACSDRVPRLFFLATCAVAVILLACRKTV